MLVGWVVGELCRSALTTADLRAVRDVAADRTAAQTDLWRAFSLIGSGYVVFPLAAVAAVLLARAGRRWAALVVALGTFGATLIGNVDKVLVGRPRPPVHHLQAAGGKSFPSGHVTHSAALGAALLIVLWSTQRSRPVRIASAVVVGLLVACIAFSRVYLGVHYPSDVVAGAVLGTAWSLCVARGLLSPPAAADRLAAGPQR